MDATLGDEEIIMFDEQDIQSRLSNRQNQLNQQKEVKNMKTVEKIQDQLPMSIINEEEIEQTIALKVKQKEEAGMTKSMIQRKLKDMF